MLVFVQVKPQCPLKMAVRNDSLLRLKFKFSEPVFQWAGSFSEAAWDKLNHKPPPYGWKGLPVDGKLDFCPDQTKCGSKEHFKKQN